MKILFIVLMLSTTAMAQDTDNKEQMLSEMKQMVASNIDERIAALQAFKSCVNGASSKEQLKTCRETHRSSMKDLHEENKGERQAFKDKRKQMREQKRKDKAAN